MTIATKATAPSPIVVGAAIAAILFCTLGTAAIMGWIPATTANQATTVAENAAPAPAANAPAGTQPYAPPQPTTAAGSTQQYAGNSPAMAPVPSYCGHCGTVESIREVAVQSKPSGLGLVGGALIGGLLGHQFFAGRGNTVSTLAGAAGGAYVGNEVEKNHSTGMRYAVKVRLEDGTTHVVHYQYLPPWREGDRIRYEHGRLESAA